MKVYSRVAGEAWKGIIGKHQEEGENLCMFRFIKTAVVLWALAMIGSAEAWANSAPIIEVWPTISSDPIHADDATVYTVTMTVRDDDGYDDIRGIRTLFNVTEGRDAGWDSSYGRGYLAWGVSDAEITQYGGSWELADAEGGGRWGYRTDDWGGTTYITPLSCTTTKDANATGGPGSRTVTWSFRAKPAWAFNPLVNDADAWASDAASLTGWLDNPLTFDVVGASCTVTAATPSAPVVSNVTATTVDVAIAPTDSPTDLFLIRIDPAPAGRPYVQADGSLGTTAVWRSRTQWSTTMVVGLMWKKQYTFQARAWDGTTSQCPSGFGSGTTVTTLDKVPLVELNKGASFSPRVRGQNPYRSVPESSYQMLWELTAGASGRGLAGGLDADTYDWRDIDSGSNWGLVGGHFTTLQFLQHARDHQAEPLITANMFGGGYKDPNDGTFICQTVEPESLAADWVRYCNIILPNYRQGDEASLTGENLRVYDSISNWWDRPRLLTVEEAPTPPVTYWEIGNEPELGGFPQFLSNHYRSPTDYRDRYKIMSQAMRAVDPTLKFGCCLMSPADPAGSGQWLTALAADPTVQLDFVGYHPYYSDIKNAWGASAAMTDALRRYKAYLCGRSDGIHDIMTAYGRTGYELFATEWNPVNWDAPSIQQRSMAMGLGIVEGVFTFVETGVDAAHFWENPQNKLSARDVFYALADNMGDTLLLNVQQMGLDPALVDWRLYATGDSTNEDRVVFWGLNFDEQESVTINLELVPPCQIVSATLKRYGKAGGGTTLTTYTDMVWSQQDITAGFNPTDFPFTMQPAEITVLVLEFIYPEIFFVDASATGANNGTSWEDAFTDLQDALAVARHDIWVAAGTYTPTSGSDRSVSYVLPEDVAIYGGFAGNEDPATFDLADRDFQANETILSGDIGVPGNNSDNSYHVVTGTDGATLDGFTITGGYANGSTTPEQSGGGMYNDATSPTVSNCTFTANEASVGGGGMYNNAAGPTVTHCTFASNSAATNGGGMYNNVASPTVTSCTFFGNAALSGGGMANASGSPTVTNCTFSNNSASRDGGAYFNWRSSPTITNCTLTANSATNNGGGMFNFASSPLIANCILWDNVGGQITSGTPIVTYSCVQGGYAGEGNIDADPLLSPLADNGGPTWTHALASNSPAYAIPESAGGGNWNGAPDTDQRGQSRATTGYRAMGALEDEYIAPPPVVVAAVSVKNHGPAGDLGIAIPLAGGVEPRLGGPARLVVTFDQDIYGSGGLPADDVTLSAGTVEAVTIDGNAVTVDIVGIPDATVLTVAFSGIESDAGQPCADTLCVRVLAGDVNGDGEVSIFDLVAMRDNTEQTVTEANCPCDVNNDGAINIFDQVNARDQTGATVGSCL